MRLQLAVTKLSLCAPLGASGSRRPPPKLPGCFPPHQLRSWRGLRFGAMGWPWLLLIVTGHWRLALASKALKFLLPPSNLLPPFTSNLFQHLPPTTLPRLLSAGLHLHLLASHTRRSGHLVHLLLFPSLISISCLVFLLAGSPRTTTPPTTWLNDTSRSIAGRSSRQRTPSSPKSFAAAARNNKLRFARRSERRT